MLPLHYPLYLHKCTTSHEKVIKKKKRLSSLRDAYRSPIAIIRQVVRADGLGHI